MEDQVAEEEEQQQVGGGGGRVVVSDAVRRICKEQQQQEGSLNWGNRLRFADLPFAQGDAHFVVDHVQNHRHSIATVVFVCCHFEDNQTVNILKEGFATEALSGVKVVIQLQPSQFPNGIRSLSYFPSLTELATFLNLSNCGLGDDSFGYVVDTMNNGSGKHRLKILIVWGNNLSSNSLQHVKRLVQQQSNLEILEMSRNDGLLDNRARFQAFCNDGLKNHKNLKSLYLHSCRTSENTMTAVTHMLVDALTVNTSLTTVELWYTSSGIYQDALFVFFRHLEPALQCNSRFVNMFSDLQALLDRQAQAQVQQREQGGEEEEDRVIKDGFWRQMLSNNLLLDYHDKSTLFLALRNGTVSQRETVVGQGETVVGQGGGAKIEPLLLRVVGAMAEQERKQRSSTRIQRWWRRRSHHARPIVKAAARTDTETTM